MNKQTPLIDIQTVRIDGALTQIARLVLPDTHPMFSDWVAFNGNAQEYEIRFRLTKERAAKLELF